MTALDRSTRRVATAVALAAGGALALSGCGAGQISQTASQVAAVNGNSANVGTLALRNVHIVHPTSPQHSLEPGGDAVLAFTAINESEGDPETLTGITSEFAGSVSIEGEADATTIAPQTSLEASGNEKLVVLEDLQKGVRPGLTVPVTFSFENAGDITLSVPVDAGHEFERHEGELSPVVGEAH